MLRITQNHARLQYKSSPTMAAPSDWAGNLSTDAAAAAAAAAADANLAFKAMERLRPYCTVYCFANVDQFQ